ncbi:hypothetical protein EEW87_16360 [Janibacter melonis]|uniref:Uncharacterized protein n=1 Tax=Janibacter melonis TaxID=262209 RepID=A0A650GE44_9MICO|nr:hypothetical protein [Janibacter melonis]QGX08244.1 hypothetical protein EEW87_16360 [Janibacter melonis]
MSDKTPAAAKAADEAKPTTRRVYHPVFPDVSHEVPTDQAKAWQKSGWRLTELPKDA